MKSKIKKMLRESLIMEERIQFDLSVPHDIGELNQIFKKNGFNLFIVGGAVRDSLLGKNPKDYDLATNATPDKVEEMMRINGIKTLATGKAFGVINVFTNKGEYEVATFRKDLSGGRRPDGVEFTNIEGDVKRRDLTINALFYDIDKKEIVDLVGGMQDIKNGVVRTVGSPEDRFGEDRLRILRAIRFAGRFGSQLDPETDNALKKDASLEGISGERIRDEFIKGIKSAKSVTQFLGMLDKYNLFNWIFKGLNVNKNFIENKDVIIQMANLLKDNNWELLPKQLNTLKYSDDEIKGVKFLLGLLKLNDETSVSLKKAQEFSGLSNDQIKTFASIEGIPSQLIDRFLKFTLTVTGQEVMAKLNIKAGPELGKAIQQIEINNFKNLK